MEENICRTCGEVCIKSKALNLFEDAAYVLVHQIEVLTNLWLIKELNMPMNICSKCQESLQHAVAFRERCIITQIKLQERKKVLECKTLIKNAIDYDIVYTDTEVEILNCEDISEAINKDNNIDYHKDECSISQEHNRINEIGVNTVGANQISIKNKMEGKEKRRIWKKDCICEHCGKYFNNTSNFKLHLLRHIGTKSYKCNVCEATFYTRHFLRQHKRKHTGERPYPCRHCDRNFRSWSNRMDHERSHTNERPFQCQYCDKSFATTSVRKEHELVHTGIRKFHCDKCDQWFLRRTHLVVHYRSKTHRKNEKKCGNYELYQDEKVSLFRHKTKN